MRLRRRREEAAPAVHDPISANLDAVVALHAVAEQQVNTHQTDAAASEADGEIGRARQDAAEANSN